MTDDSLTLAEEWMYSSSMMSFKLLFIPHFLLASLLPIPPPWGNMAFEVNTICFVAFLWWLNNGFKYVAKWESGAGDGSNLAFLSERWHRPIEINERAGVLTLSLLLQKQHLLGSVLFTFTNNCLLALFCCTILASTQKKTPQKQHRWYFSQDFRNAGVMNQVKSQPYHPSLVSKCWPDIHGV